MLKTDRKWELVLYSDSTSYNCDEVISQAKNFFNEWAFVLHDKDVYEDGSPKKPHYHLIGKLPHNFTPSGICFHLGITDSSLANISSWKGAVRYLMHLDNPEKHQYSNDEIQTNFSLVPFLVQKEDDTAQASQIYAYITESNPSLQEVVEYCLRKNLWSAFRRGFAVWSKLINFNSKEERLSYESYRHS